MKFEKTEVFNFEGALRGMRNPLNSWNKSDSLFYIEPDTYYGSDWVLRDWAYEQLKNEDVEFPTEEEQEEAVDYLIGEKTEFVDEDCIQVTAIGKNDMRLARKLIEGGSEHRKFLRQIIVSVDITAPLFFWKEFDTYKVGTVANSTSTMHKLASTPITLECFETDDYTPNVIIDQGIDDSGDTAYRYAYEVKDFIENSNVPFHYEETLIGFLETLRQRYNETKDPIYWKELVRWLPESWLQKRTITMNYENLRNMYHQRKNHKLSEWHRFCEWIETLPYAREFIIN